MIISDLSHLDIISEDDAILGSAGTVTSALANASGNYSKTEAVTRAYAIPLPYNGSLATGFGYAKADAVDADDASANTDVSGDTEGDIGFVIGGDYSIDSGRKAKARGFVTALAITLPG